MEESSQEEGLFGGDLITFPCRESARADWSQRIIQAAKDFLRGHEPQDVREVSLDKYDPRELAGGRALLVLHCDPRESLEDLNEDVWAKWGPVLLRYNIPTTAREQTVHQILLRQAYDKAPEPILQAIPILLDKEDETDLPGQHILRNLDPIWDNDIADCLTTKAQDDELGPELWVGIINSLIAHGVESGENMARRALDNIVLNSGKICPRALGSASALLQYSDDGGWETVFPAMEKNEDFSRKMLSQAVRNERLKPDKLAAKLKDIQLADLFIHMSKLWPETGSSSLTDKEHGDMIRFRPTRK